MRSGVPAQPLAWCGADFEGSARLLWSACRRWPDPRQVRQAIEVGVDAEATVAASLGHRIGGLLWRALSSAGALETLGEGLPRLARVADVQRLREVLLVPRALELSVAPLTDAGFEPVVLKGPGVAVRYPEPGLRPFDDLDLLLPPAQHDDALAVLGMAGWRLVRPQARDRYDSVLVHREVPDMPLELHYSFEAWYDRASSLRAEELWSRRRPVEVFGVQGFALAPFDELVMLCAHAAKPYHCFSRLVWVADLAMVLGDLTERGEPLDWDRVRELAIQSRCRTALAAALSLAQLAGAPSPSDLRVLPRAGWRGEALRRLVGGEWVLRPAPPIHLRFALADDRRRRAMLLVGHAHTLPGVRGRLWHLRSLGHFVRRWRDLRRRRGRTRPALEPEREKAGPGPFSVRTGR